MTRANACERVSAVNAIASQVSSTVESVCQPITDQVSLSKTVTQRWRYTSPIRPDISIATSETTATHAATTTYLAVQSACRELSAVREARIMPCRYSWPHAKIPIMATRNPTRLGIAPDAANCVTRNGPKPSTSSAVAPLREKSWWPTQPSSTEISRATASAEPVSHQVERMVRIRAHS